MQISYGVRLHHALHISFCRCVRATPNDSQINGNENHSGRVKTVLSVQNTRCMHSYSVSQIEIAFRHSLIMCKHACIPLQMNTMKRYVCLWSNWMYCKHCTTFNWHGHWSCSHFDCVIFSTSKRYNCSWKLSVLESAMFFRVCNMFYCRCCTLWARNISTKCSETMINVCFKHNKMKSV